MTRDQQIISRRIIKAFPTPWDLPSIQYSESEKKVLCQSQQKRLYLLSVYEFSKDGCIDAVFDAVYCNATRQRKFFADVEIALTEGYNLSFATLWSIITRTCSNNSAL